MKQYRNKLREIYFWGFCIVSIFILLWLLKKGRISKEVLLIDIFGVKFLRNYFNLLILLCIIGIFITISNIMKDDLIGKILLIIVLVISFIEIFSSSFFKFLVSFILCLILFIIPISKFLSTLCSAILRLYTFILWIYLFKVFFKTIIGYSYYSEFKKYITNSVIPLLTQEGEIFMFMLLAYSSYFSICYLADEFINARFKKCNTHWFISKIFYWFSIETVTMDFKTIYFTYFLFINSIVFFEKNEIRREIELLDKTLMTLILITEIFNIAYNSRKARLDSLRNN